MLITASSGSAASVVASKLQKTPAGEYTAGSVAVNPNEAISKLLMRLQDGNYVSLSSPLARSSVGVRSAIYGLSLGG